MKLDMNVSLKKDAKVVIPTKRQINFANVGKKKSRIQIIAPLTAIIIALLVAFSVVFIVRPFMELNSLNEEVLSVQDELNVAYKQLQQYNDLESDYAHYSYNGYNAYELMLPDRDKVIDLVYDVISPKAYVDKWTINENQLFVSIVGSDVKTVNAIAHQLEANEIVSYCDIQMASKSTNTNIDAQLTIYLFNNGGVQ